MSRDRSDDDEGFSLILHPVDSGLLQKVDSDEQIHFRDTDDTRDGDATTEAPAAAIKPVHMQPQLLQADGERDEEDPDKDQQITDDSNECTRPRFSLLSLVRVIALAAIVVCLVLYQHSLEPFGFSVRDFILSNHSRASDGATLISQAQLQRHLSCVRQQAAGGSVSDLFSPRLHFYFLDDDGIDAGHSSPRVDTGRYLRSRIDGQFNNHRQALTLTILFALALNRTVIIKRGDEKFRFGEVFDLDRLARLVPLISQDEYEERINQMRTDANTDAHGNQSHPALVRLQEVRMNSVAWKDLWYLSKSRDYDADPDQQSFVASQGPHTTLPRFLLDEFDATDSAAHNAVTIYQDHAWTFLRQSVAFPQNVMDRFSHQLRRHMHYRLDIYQRAGRILDAIADMQSDARNTTENTFFAVHWRQRDFYESVRLHVPTILAHLDTWKLSPGSVLYIGTDDPNGEETRSLTTELRSTTVRVVSFDDFATVMPAVADFTSRSLRPFIDQLVMAHARRFMPTPQSTYSEFILLMRQWMSNPHADDELRAYDLARKFVANPLLGVRRPTRNASVNFLNE